MPSASGPAAFVVFGPRSPQATRSEDPDDRLGNGLGARDRVERRVDPVTDLDLAGERGPQRPVDRQDSVSGFDDDPAASLEFGGQERVGDLSEGLLRG